jgi:DMSO/TMAO reductase YedYZ molybdopterin-dependent catalytic subunit
MAQLKAKSAVSGYWGAHKDNTSVHRYTGVPLSDLLAEVGGLPAGKGLRITASDGFTCDYEAKRLASMIDGAYQMWDCNGTLVTLADDIETTGSVQMVVAYAMDGQPLPTKGEGAGPLRVVLIQNNQSMLTEGKYSPYLVKSIAVR